MVVVTKLISLACFTKKFDIFAKVDEAIKIIEFLLILLLLRNPQKAHIKDTI